MTIKGPFIWIDGLQLLRFLLSQPFPKNTNNTGLYQTPSRADHFRYWARTGLVLMFFFFPSSSSFGALLDPECPPVIVLSAPVHINIPGPAEAKGPFRCNKVSSMGWMGHLPEALTLCPCLSDSPCVSLPLARAIVHTRGRNRKAALKLSIQVLMELCYQFPAARNWREDGDDEERTKFCSVCLLSKRERDMERKEITKGGSTSSAVMWAPSSPSGPVLSSAQTQRFPTLKKIPKN